jgi:hypothetical protein
MYPSYPSHRRHTDLSVQFGVPSQKIVQRILDDSLDYENLRRRAAANVLFPHIDCLARLMSRHRIQIEEISSNELGITLFLPPPPCPPPKSKPFSKFKRAVLRKCKMPTFIEKSFAEVQATGEWITMYHYVPADEQPR